MEIEHAGTGGVKRIPRPEAPAYTLCDLGDERVLRVQGREFRTHYSARVLEKLIERKGIHRTPPYLGYRTTRSPHLLGPLFRYLAARGAAALTVLEVGCSFGHNTEYLHEQPLVAAVHAFDVDPAFADITRMKVADLGLTKVRDVLLLGEEETTRLPFADGAFDLVLVVGVVEHLPWPSRHRYVDEYYRVLAPGGHIAILDTPNRAFPLETHSIGLPGIQWLPARAAFAYARACRPGRVAQETLATFARAAWRNAPLAHCLPSGGTAGLVDVTEEAGYGWRFFRATARSRLRRALLPAFAVSCALLSRLGRPPSLALPYLNLVFRKRPG